MDTGIFRDIRVHNGISIQQLCLSPLKLGQVLLSIWSEFWRAAARRLGSKSFKVLRRIHLPMLRPSLIAAILLVFVDVMREPPATLILRPFNFETLATRVYRLASDERLAEASISALVIVLVGLVVVTLLNRLNFAENSDISSTK